MTLPDPVTPPTKHEVEHLFGQCLLRFQAFEFLMKSIVARHRVSGSKTTKPEDALTRRASETRRKTMGFLVNDMMGSVLVPAGQEGLPDTTEAASVSSFAFVSQISFPPEEFAKIEAEHRGLLMLRNSLVHNFLVEHDLRSEAGCLVAGKTLTAAIDRVIANSGLGQLPFVLRAIRFPLTWNQFVRPT